jgi:hypothetical protein
LSHAEPTGRKTVEDERRGLDELQNAYKSAVEEWIAAIRKEEALASVNHSVAEIDQWEQAHFQEEELRSKAKEAKKEYEARCGSSSLPFRSDEQRRVLARSPTCLGATYTSS